MKKCNIIYFSSNQDHASAFESKARSLLNKLTTDYLTHSFKTEDEFNSAQAKSSLFDEIHILDSYVVSNGMELDDFLTSYDGKLSELYVIIDYVSFCGKEFPSKANSIKIRELILKYPEVNFSFDEHLVVKEKIPEVSFLDFLLTTEHLSYRDYVDASYLVEEDKESSFLVKELVNKEMHSFNIDNEDSILRLCYFNDNLFDASNLRFALKAQKYANLVVNKPNFARVQLSRAKNLALIVEEERSQNLFNCYAAYACGYRSLPVTTASGLKWANTCISPQVILRDYDLQFPDEPGDKEIHQIRGWKSKELGERIPWKCTLDVNNVYWKNFYHYDNIVSPSIPILGSKLNKLYYISKGVEGLVITLKSPYGINRKNNHKLKLPGIEKPVSGIYAKFHSMFKGVYDAATYRRENSKKDYIDTTRKKGYHGVPLDIYYMVKSMVERAKLYYSEKRYIHAAVLAQEIIEVLNGFHEALLLNAYHILAISENAIAMNTIGGDEKALKEDALFRINKIEYEVERILHRTKEESNGDEDRKEFMYNILNQIFSDCRKFCKDKEHFAAEDCFISAMACVNEGFTPCDILREFSVIWKKTRDSWAKKEVELCE